MTTAEFHALPFGALLRRVTQSAAYDWAMRLPMMIGCGYLLLRNIDGFYRQAAQDPSVFRHLDADIVIAMLARISQWMVVLVLSLQPLFRLRAVRKSDEILPRVVALIAVSIPLIFMQLDPAPPNIVFNLLSVIVGLIANVMCLVTLSYLGRSLSVMPEARRLVRTGPYGIVRHPLYLCELLATFAFVLQYRSLAAAGLLALGIVLQTARARWEEQVLARAFADFAAYRARTSFLLPRDPVHFLAVFLIAPGVRRRSAVAFAAMATLLAVIAVAAPRLFT